MIGVPNIEAVGKRHGLRRRKARTRGSVRDPWHAPAAAEPIPTEVPSPYLLHLHSRAITGEIHPRERTKRNLFQTTMCTLPYAIVAPIMVPHRSRTDRGRRVIESPSGKEMHKEK